MKRTEAFISVRFLNAKRHAEKMSLIFGANRLFTIFINN